MSRSKKDKKPFFMVTNKNVVEEHKKMVISPDIISRAPKSTPCGNLEKIFQKHLKNALMWPAHSGGKNVCGQIDI